MSNQAPLGVLRVQIVGGGQDEMPIYQSVVKLGRGKDNDVILSEPMVSGHHAQLNMGRDGWLVGDLNSSNGTFLNG